MQHDIINEGDSAKRPPEGFEAAQDTAASNKASVSLSPIKDEIITDLTRHSKEISRLIEQLKKFVNKEARENE